MSRVDHGRVFDRPVMVYSFENGRSLKVIDGDARPYCALSKHLVYGRGGAVLTAPFDPSTLAVTGPAAVITDGVAPDGFNYSYAYSLSASGRLVFGRTGRGGRLVWVNRDSSSEPITDDGRVFQLPRLSPDNSLLAAQTVRESGTDIVVYRFANRTTTRLSTDGASNAATWGPDGQRIVYRGPGGLFVQAIDGIRGAAAFLAAR